MKKNKQYINIEIDTLTNSIINVITSEVFDTNVERVTAFNLKEIKGKDWVFDWKKEFETENREVYKLHTTNNPDVIQGMMSIEDIGNPIFLHLIENASFNKGEGKVYMGVPGNLVAFACKISIEKGYDGVVSFLAKTTLIDHYKETLRAQVLFGNQMFIDSLAAAFLIERYYNK